MIDPYMPKHLRKPIFKKLSEYFCVSFSSEREEYVFDFAYCDEDDAKDEIVDALEEKYKYVGVKYADMEKVMSPILDDIEKSLN